MIGKFNSETQTANENIWTLTYTFDSSLVPCISRGILKRYPPPPKKKKNKYYIKITLIFILKMTSKIKSIQFFYGKLAFILNVFSRNCLLGK